MSIILGRAKTVNNSDPISSDSDLHLSIEKIGTSMDQFNLFKKLYYQYDRAFILESLVGPKELAEMSVIGFDPQQWIVCDYEKFRVYDRSKLIAEEPVSDPLVQLRKFVPRVNDDRYRYIGGAVGYVSYDAIRFWEKMPQKKRKKSKFPLIEFGIYTDGILYNHLEGQAYYFYIGKQSRLKDIESKIVTEAQLPKNANFSYTLPKRNMTRRNFMSVVKKAKKCLYDGDIFQVVLSKSINFKVKGDIFAVYQSLRDINPSPYMYLLKSCGNCIIGSSPEMLLRITKNFVETFPIAGTRPVVDDENENERMRLDLLSDEKEIAEHTMLVDLARNDIGRVCKFGTVKVEELMTVKKFSHVQHIVSHVTGYLQKGYDCIDAFKSLFPAGTVSGAPKVRAMEIINDLEPSYRGPYAGAVGYFSSNGSCDFAIAIRSIFISGTNAYIQSGAGVVIDSDPQKEWFETEQKAGALISAIKNAKKLKD